MQGKYLFTFCIRNKIYYMTVFIIIMVTIMSILTGCGSKAISELKENADYSDGEMCQGTWIQYAGRYPTKSYMTISGNEVVFYFENEEISRVTTEFTTDNNHIIFTTGKKWWGTINDSDGGLYLFEGESKSELEEKLKSGYSPLTYKFATRDITTIHYDLEPYLGMAREELELSSWGKPDDINKTTTENGVHEQWVYSNNRYIYLDDGIVTAIQD